MADFCKECSKDLFNADTNDLTGIVTAEDTAKGFISSVVICEGCGPIQVDHEGSCKSEDCIGDHRKLTPHTADVEQALDDGEETEQDGLCYECDLPHEDCECDLCEECDLPMEECSCGHEPDDCEDCGLDHDDCECGDE